MARTINSPGVEIFERDESETSSLQAGTNILVQGFAHQGPTNELIRISSKDELNQVYFGGNGPTNDAERFFYHSCAEILNSPANLYTIRLPYGLSDGEGFSGKYVALAYGGQVRPQPVTKTVHRMVVEGESFIPDDEPYKTIASATLYEFSKNTIAASSTSTSAFYKAIEAYVTGTHGSSAASAVWDYADEFPLNDEHFWVATGTSASGASAIDISPKSSANTTTYNYPVYTRTSGASALKFEIDVKKYRELGSASISPSSIDWAASASPAGTVIVAFENVGTFTNDFVDNVLEKSIVAYDEKSGSAMDGINPFNAFDYFYAELPLTSGDVPLTGSDQTIESYMYYRFTLKKTVDEWNDAISAAGSGIGTTTDLSLKTAYQSDDLIAVYAHKNGERINCDDLILDTETIGDTILTEINKKINSSDFLPSGTIALTATFEQGLPLQDAKTMSVSYDGPLTVEAIDPQSYGRVYTLNAYKNKIATNRIREYDYQEPQVNERGEPIMENVLTINPVPLAVPLTEYQYTAIQEGAVNFAKPEYTLEGIAAGEDAFQTILGKSAFYVVNKMQTSIDEKYQGFYVAFMDSSKFYEQAYGNISDSYDAIKKIDYVETPNQDGNVQTTELPKETLGFDVAGPESLSTDIMSGVVGIDLAKPENSDNLVVATIRCGRRASSSDPSKLTYDLKDVTFGSFDVDSTVVDPVTKGVVPNRIDTKMKANDYVELVMNAKFDFKEYKPARVKFGGAVWADKDQEAGTCCSLGVEVPCVEDNRAEYIGSIPGKLDKSLSLCDNVYDFDLDILVDAGLSTIWAYVKEDDEHGACEFNATKYIKNNVGTPYELLTHSGDDYAESPYYQAFDTIRIKYNDFCAKTRKDCMYLLDPLRACFVRGKDTKLLSIDGKIFTIDVARPLRNLFSNANSSYGAAYANWVKIYDSFSDEYIWMPSSPFEAAIMARVDANYYPWYAPYGLNNGILSSISDIALRFSPKQQDDIYKMGLNMFVFFNGDGFVSWGQKTLQTKASALDRINVRRLFLTLERATFKTVRYFIAEPNTPFTRTRVVNSITPLFETAKHNEGCYSYQIFCDERNNTSQVIDNNELVIDVYIKPTRVIDFIEVTFHATKTDANFEELYNG